MENSYILVFGLLLGCLAATVPVFMALFFAGTVGLVFVVGIDPQIVIDVLYRSMDKFALVVVIFFVLCGNIMTTGSIVEKLIKTANVMVGFLPGGLAMAGVLACGFFGAISGSTVATVVAIGGFMIPALIENSYEEKFAVGIMTTAPILGVIIPPSIAMILYAMVTNDQLEALFLTGFLPGILIMIAMSLYAYFVCKKMGMKRRERPSVGEVFSVLKESVWALLLPVLIFGGIYSGLFTANEAAVVACFYAFFVEIAIHRDIVYVTRAVLPFLVIQILILFLLTFWPDLVLLLPRLVYG